MPPSTLVYSNRDIVELRAGLLGRTPAERAAAAFERLDAIAEAGPDGPVSSVIVENVGVISVGTQNAFVVVPADLDELRGETLQQKVSLAAARLQTAMDEQTELRSPARVAWGALQALIATVVFVPLLWTIVRTHRVLVVRVPETAEQQLQKISASHLQLVRASHAPEILRHAVTAAAVIAGLALSYVWLTFVLRRFPYTRPWGESLREFLLARLVALGLAVVHSLPDLFTVLVIVLITRFAVRLTYLVFDAVEQERLTLPAVYPETAQPTRRLVTTLMWLLALIASYPYLPGSDSDAFKGVSVFVGLVVSLGSSGIVNQVMSGMTLTYSRALRLGDFVRIGEIEGTVTHLGNLSTKVKTPAPRRHHHPQCRRRVHADHQLLPLCCCRRRPRSDDRHHWLRRAVAAGSCAPAAGRGANGWNQTHASPCRASSEPEGLSRRIRAARLSGAAASP